MMKKFLKRAIVFCCPFLSLAMTYTVADPFRVIRDYEVYFDTTSIFPVNIPLVSTMTYVNQRDKYHYDSFIFENSRSLFYDVKDWEKYLDGKSSCLHFWTNGGYIKSWHDKVKFIDENQDTIKNALCVLDHEALSRLDIESDWRGMEPPILNHYQNCIDFQMAHFMAFLNLKFLLAVVDYKVFGEYREYMKDYLSNPAQRLNYDMRTNEQRRPNADAEIANGTYYDVKRMKAFENVQKPGTFSEHILTTEERQLIREIREIFNRHHTNYEIVLGPQFDQIKPNGNTMSFLYETFGREHVHDFTGVNKWTTDYHNYYESSHYRPCVAAEIMDIVYSK